MEKPLIKGSAVILGLGSLIATYKTKSKVALSDNYKRQQVFGWGSNKQGQLGIGSANQGVTIPVIVPELDGMNIISTSAF